MTPEERGEKAASLKKCGATICKDLKGRDTGAGAALERNAAALGFAALPETVVLSHGHNDHTGGLPSLSEGTVYVAPGVRRTRFSLHPGKTPHDLTMPATDLRTVEVRDFLEVVPGANAARRRHHPRAGRFNGLLNTQ